MAWSSRLESVATAVVGLAGIAFLASFGLGLRPTGRPASTVPANSPILVVPDPSAGRIEVLNASGRAGLARSVTQRLREAGFDVVFYGNATGFDGDASLVLDRTGDAAVARAVARRLGIGTVRTQRDTTLLLDATVVLGRDYDSR